MIDKKEEKNNKKATVFEECGLFPLDSWPPVVRNVHCNRKANTKQRSTRSPLSPCWLVVQGYRIADALAALFSMPAVLPRS